MKHEFNIAALPHKVRQRLTILPLCAVAVVLAGLAEANGKASYVTFDPNGSIETQAWCMNNSGTIAGIYYDSNKVSHGFVRADDGTITAFDPPESTGTGVGYAQCVNAKGWITGSYLDSTHVSHGYVRAFDGTVSTFDPAGSTGTSAYGINSAGLIAGSYMDANGESHGFFRTSDGTITSFDPPGSDGTMASQVNLRGEIAGDYYDADGSPYVFVRRPDGKYTSSSLGGAALFDIYTTGINDKGTVTGWAIGDCGLNGICEVSFVWEPGGAYTFFLARESHHSHGSYGTSANCINRNGLIAGDYSVYPHPQHGFIRSAGGTILRLDPPGSSSTSIYGCNAQGDLTGYYVDANGISHGFLRSK